MADAGVTVADVRQCLVVGGSSRIPIVQKELMNEFPGVTLLHEKKRNKTQNKKDNTSKQTKKQVSFSS